MITKFILIFLALAIFTNAMVPIPFLQQDTEEKWFIHDVAIEKLKQFGDREIHVVAIGGPTRAGKSFTMEKILPKFDEVYFGAFLEGKTMTSVTEGVDIALVELNNQLILLLDCEGLSSISKKMDPKLMTIISLISQQMIYLTLGINDDLLNHLGVMLANRKVAVQTMSGSNGQKLKEKDLPLDTLQIVLNQTELEDDERNPHFIQNVLQSHQYSGMNIKVPFNNAFPHQNLLFITYLDEDYEALFEDDLQTFFNTITSYVSPFKFDGKIFTIGEYLNHIQIVLDNVNNNENMVIKTKTEFTFSTMANNVISELMETPLEIQDEYMDEIELQKLMNKIENKKKEFEKRTSKYADEIVEKKQLYFKQLDDFIEAAKERNERFGDIIVDNRTEYSEKDETSTETEDGLECTIATTKKYCRNVATQKNGEMIYGEWKFYDTSRRTINAKKEESVLNTICAIGGQMLMQVACNVISNKISDALTKKPNQIEKSVNSSDPFDRLHDNSFEHHEFVHSHPESEYMTLDDNILNSDFHQNFDDQLQLDTRCDTFEPKIQLCSYSHVNESNNSIDSKNVQNETPNSINNENLKEKNVSVQENSENNLNLKDLSDLKKLGIAGGTYTVGELCNNNPLKTFGKAYGATSLTSMLVESTGRERTAEEKALRTAMWASGPFGRCAEIYSNVAEFSMAQEHKIMEDARNQVRAQGGTEVEAEKSAIWASPCLSFNQSVRCSKILDEKTKYENSSKNSNSQIKESVKGLENNIMKGYDAKQEKWYPHKSPEGGLDTIGFGHKITSKEEQIRLQKEGLSNAEVNKLFNKDWQKAREGASKQLKNYGWDNATEVQKDMATELQYNTGNLKQYKKFNEALKNGNTQEMMNQNNRGFTDGNGKRQQLITRQNEINKAAKKDMSSSNNREMKI